MSVTCCLFKIPENDHHQPIMRRHIQPDMLSVGAHHNEIIAYITCKTNIIESVLC